MKSYVYARVGRQVRERDPRERGRAVPERLREIEAFLLVAGAAQHHHQGDAFNNQRRPAHLRAPTS
jgi:hypothetical protein